MPILSSSGGASANAFGLFKLDLGGGYWGASIATGRTVGEDMGSIFIDNTSKACYFTYTSSGPQVSIVKLKSDGTFDFQRTYSASLPSAGHMGGGGVDSSGNVFWGGYQNSAPNRRAFMLKMTSAGSLTTQVAWNNGGITSCLGRTLAINPGGAQVVLASTDSNSSLNPQLNLFDGSLNTASQVYTSSGGNQSYCCCLMPDQARLTTWGSAQQTMITGASTRRWSVTVSSSLVGVACTNSNGQLFSTSSSGGNGLEAGEIDATTGAAIWARRLTSSFTQQDNQGVAANNTYVYNMMYGGNGTVNNIYISKRLASNGTLIWQRQFSSNTSSNQNLRHNGGYVTNGQIIAVDSSDTNLWVSFYNNTAPGTIYIWKLPADGSKTGTYSLNGLSFTYSASSLTDTSYTATRTSDAPGVNTQSVAAPSVSNTLSSSQTTTLNKVTVS